MESIFKFFQDHPYMTYMLAVNLFTAGLRHTFFSAVNLGPKWITLTVGSLLGILMLLMGWINLDTPYEFFILFASLGASSAFYDYIIKFIIDVARKRNPFLETKQDKEEHGND